MTPRNRAMATATAVFMKQGSTGGIWDALVNALERCELLEADMVKAAELRAEERAHHAALVQASKALRREGVNPVTWSAVRRALAACGGQKNLEFDDRAS